MNWKKLSITALMALAAIAGFWRGLHAETVFVFVPAVPAIIVQNNSWTAVAKDFDTLVVGGQGWCRYGSDKTTIYLHVLTGTYKVTPDGFGIPDPIFGTTKTLECWSGPLPVPVTVGPFFDVPATLGATQ